MTKTQKSTEKEEFSADFREAKEKLDSILANIDGEVGKELLRLLLSVTA